MMEEDDLPIGDDDEEGRHEDNRSRTTKEKVSLYQVTSPLLHAMTEEMQALCRKKPDATLSNNKVKIINRLLEDVRSVLSNEPELKYLDLLDEDTLPQYSDVTLMLSQYRAAMHRYYDRYTSGDYLGERDWVIGEKEME